MRLLAMLCFKESLLDLGVRASHIKIFGILDSFRPELKAKTRVFKKRSSLAVKGLAETFCRTIYLRGIWLYKL
jgi:hypothetical protein